MAASGTRPFRPVRRDLAVQITPPIEPELIDKRSALSDEPPSLAQVRLLAQLMDSAFEIPGLRMRVGLDAILGLLPGVGDLASSFVSLYILQAANRRGVSRLILSRMAFNVLVDWLVGSIPLAGDVFDVFWKSNQKNVHLLLQHKGTPANGRRSKTGDWLFLGLLIATLMLVFAGSLAITLFIASRMTRWLLAD